MYARVVLARLAPILSLILVAAACVAPSVPSTASPQTTAGPSPISTAVPSAQPSPRPTPSAASTPQTTPQATGSPSPASPSPTPAATSAAGLVVSEDEIARHLDALQQIANQNGGLRAAGLPGYDASAAYVADELRRLGYEITPSPFEFSFFDEAAPVELIVGDQTWTGADWLHAMLYSAPGDVAGVLEQVSMEGEFSTGTGGCFPGDWAGFTAGHIALVGSGPCFRRDQIINAQQAGAIGLISLYPRWELGQTRRPTLVDPEGITIPAIVAGQEPTAVLLSAAQAGGSAQIRVSVTLDRRTVDNVIAELPGTGDGVIMLGGHLDSVLDGPGLNDNGSGVAALLAIAAAVAAQGPPNATIRFGFWAAEEFGDLGSHAYVGALPASEIERIRAYFNLDMIGSPNAARLVYDNELSPPGSDELTTQLAAAFAALGAPTELFDAGPSSDHFAFEQAGIPIGGVFSGLAPLTDDQAALFGGQANVPADACYHLLCDDRANVNTATAALFGQAVADVVEELAF